MRDAYGPYMEDHRAELSESDRERFGRQRAKAEEICTFLEVPIAGEDDPRLVPLLELMHEFSELGEPPANLADYAPKRTEASAEE
ncbi:Peroxin 19 [Leptomonas pyrrhocoris]|uniref:Peroxin 19 n=1 Tax=Leptomonas pyrrhocoris TaxID=157538 RepID=A0A0M9GAV4_LEPPY|nr:Peroxin 19 [Leptomonas pyrrhocoris]KPA86369.1 Peroxin 19 [Leptomonas pyrrhocoris]|eukprot:XP_015664808.1 Peroxin 19 [Leptomonas pyrrhocoris]